MNELGLFDLVFPDGTIRRGEIGKSVREHISKTDIRPVQYRLHLTPDIDIHTITTARWNAFTKWLEELQSCIKTPSLISDKKYDEPPIDLMSRDLWKETRLDNIKEAISRYVMDNKKIPTGWLAEYNQILNSI